MTKTYGTLGWTRGTRGKAGTWTLDVPPHVAIKIKRMFPRAAQARTRSITMLDTPEVAADIHWLTQRYPLVMDEATRNRLGERFAEYATKQETITAILSGNHAIDGLHEPAVTPRPYQVQGADLAYATGGLLLGDVVGLGKTLTSALLFRHPETLPALVVVPTHLPKQWQRRLAEYMPWLKTHIITKGTPIIRTKQGTIPYDTGDADVFIINYAKLAGWRDVFAGQVNSVIFDEVQDLRRSGSDKYNAAAHIASQATWKQGLSATPIYNYGGEAHTIMEVLSPGALGTREEFLREWGGSERATGQIVVEDPDALGEYLRDQGLLLVRTREEVGMQLERPVEDIIEVPSDHTAINAVIGDAAALADRLLNAEDHTERFVASGQFDMKMRQATGIDKAPYVAEFVRLLLESEHKVVLYGWHRLVYDIWLAALAEYGPVMYTGSESPTQKDGAVQRFLTDDDCRVFVCSLRSGAGLDDLQKVCNIAVFGELDWSPATHHQALGRLARDGQENLVLGYYLVSEVGSDPHLRTMNEAKIQQAQGILDPTGQLFTPAPDKSERIKQMAREVLARVHHHPPPSTAVVSGPSAPVFSMNPTDLSPDEARAS